MSWDWQLRRLFIRLTIAEDPSKPALLRTWGREIEDGKTQEAIIFKLSRSIREYDDGDRQSAWSLIFGPVSLWLALINKR